MAVSSSGVPLTSNELKELVSYYEEHYKSPDGGVRSSYKALYVRARR